MEDNSLKKGVMDAIEKGKVRMRPKWHFLLHSAFALVGTAIIFFTLLYIASLFIFFMRASGVWFVPSFGLRGWYDFFFALPWLLLILILTFIVLLEILVRRYAFVYKKPLVISLLGILAFILAGGFGLAHTSLHRHMAYFAAHDLLPTPMKFIYRGPLRVERPEDVYRGEIIATTSSGFIVKDVDDDSMSTIVVTKATRRPYGDDFSVGSFIVVIADRIATGTLRAFGVRAIDGEQ